MQNVAIILRSIKWIQTQFHPNQLSERSFNGNNLPRTSDKENTEAEDRSTDRIQHAPLAITNEPNNRPHIFYHNIKIIRATLMICINRIQL